MQTRVNPNKTIIVNFGNGRLSINLSFTLNGTDLEIFKDIAY